MVLFTDTQIMKPPVNTGVHISEKHTNSELISISFIPFGSDG